MPLLRPDNREVYLWFTLEVSLGHSIRNVILLGDRGAATDDDAVGIAWRPPDQARACRTVVAVGLEVNTH